ncbi:MAG: TRAP transporter substrate-binding protein [Rhodobacteraceae bacterium]|nr:TRAP transporter substrate-binding protein [Paracoccaceae bacterium]
MTISTGTLRGMAVALTAMAAAGAVQAQTVLTFNWAIPPTHLMRTEIFEPWAARVAEVTDGELQVQFTTTSLGPMPRQVEIVMDGVVDLAWSVHGYTPERFPHAGVSELPFLTLTGEAASVAYWRAYQEFFADKGEHEGYRLLAVYVHSPGTVMSRATMLDSLDAFDGLLIRSGGGMQDRVAAALGAAVVSSPAPTTYELLSNGVVEATLMTPDGYTSFNLSDFINVQLLVPGGLFNSSFYVLMNEDSYAALPEHLREALDSVTGEYLSAMGGRGFDTVSAEALEVMREAGGTIIEADEAMVAAMRERIEFLQEEWVEMIGRVYGVDGNEVIAFMLAEQEAYEAARQ